MPPHLGELRERNPLPPSLVLDREDLAPLRRIHALLIQPAGCGRRRTIRRARANGQLKRQEGDDGHSRRNREMGAQ
jgi:hypothetical protein